MIRSNYIIVWHDRHRDDIYKVVLNATWEEAEKVELEIAKKAGWEFEEDAVKYGYGDYGYGEDYYIDMQPLEDSQLTDFTKKD